MRALPLDIGVIHFVGIGGIGMSGIAEILHNLGYKVRGSDIADSYNTKRLRDRGIQIEIGHRAENLGDAAVVVISSAVKSDNPEVQAARARLLPVVRRAEMLGELMRLKWSVAVGGTHGKTTTTSLVAALLESAGFDPTVINGGIINNYGTNARLGAGDWMVVEADESDGSFTKLPATIAIVTNMDAEHLDYYGSVEAMNRAYETFVENIPFYGFAALCIDHPVVQAMIPRLIDRRIVTYGFSPQADVRAVDLTMHPDGSEYRVVINDRYRGAKREIAAVRLPMVGQHNVQNSLAAIAVANEMGVADAKIRGGLAGFGGVKRRFTRTGEARGVTVIDDYGHHPVEIAAVLTAARQAGRGQVVAVVQPHRFTRLQSLFNEFCTCFNDADAVLVADVYSAGEAPIAGVNAEALVQGLRERGHRHADLMPDPKGLAGQILPMVRAGDLVVCLGAGSITYWAQALPSELESAFSGRDGAKIARSIEMSAVMIQRRPLIDRLPPVRGRLTAGAGLAGVTWFRAGGAAEVLFKPADLMDLQAFLERKPKDVPVTVLGVGSNLLVRDGGIPGVVLRLGRAFADIRVAAGHIHAGAAALDINVALSARDAGIAGIEFLSGVPGTIGGALRMNAGAYGSDMAAVTVHATALDGNGRLHRLDRDDLDFTYRHSAVPADWIFVGVELAGKPDSPQAIQLRIAEIQAARGGSQPVRARTGGSTFTNPPHRKAWELIDAAGCRGLKIGEAMVSEKHCNFLINTGAASAADLEALGEEVRRRVKAHSGVELQWEIKRIGVPADLPLQVESESRE